MHAVLLYLIQIGRYDTPKTKNANILKTVADSYRLWYMKNVWNLQDYSKIQLTLITRYFTTSIH